MKKEYKKELKFLIKVAKECYKIIKNGVMEVKDKGEDDIVTNLDLEVEKHIIKRINKTFPTFEIVSEEFNNKAKICNNCFTIDPIDGTINFAHGIPLWSIQIACIRENNIVASVIYNPCAKELYWATKGGGAYLNGKKISVSSLPLNKSLATVHGHGDEADKVTQVYEEYRKITANFRRFGSTSLSFAYVAKGALCGTTILSSTAWDVAPGMLLCKEAGAKIYTNEEGHVIVGQNEEYIDIMKKILKKFKK